MMIYISTSSGYILDAYLLHNTEEGLGVEEGSQPVGRSFGHAPGQQPVKEGEPEHQILHPLPQRPAERGRRRPHQLLPVTGRTERQEGEGEVYKVRRCEESVSLGVI